jgi:hypothetical protein
MAKEQDCAMHWLLMLEQTFFSTGLQGVSLSCT